MPLGYTVYGIASGASSTRDVDPGSSPVEFFFVSGGPAYRTAAYVPVEHRQNVVYTIYNNYLLLSTGPAGTLRLDRIPQTLGSGTD